MRLADLSRVELAQLAREYMLLGHIYDRALMPQVVARFGTEEITPLGIHEWMGASPVYTARMRDLMGIDGDDVTAICKALQLDVGFTHQYMDVGYRVVDADHAEFWLNHCGALMDVEPYGDAMVIDMCHHIEDPTFDATATATNPHARIRPIHRPPRAPADRHPHCHWTITIDSEVEPVVEDPLTARVRELPIASIPNAMPNDREEGGWRDYRAALDPEFALDALSQGALVAVAREFAIQAHLLSASAELFLSDRYEPERVRDVLGEQMIGAGWIMSERIAAVRGLGAGDLDAVLEVLALHPVFAPFDLTIESNGDQAEVVIHGPDDVLVADAPGWAGLLARDDRRAWEAAVGGVAPTAVATVTGPNTIAIRLDPARADELPPQPVTLAKLSGSATWEFADPEPVAVKIRP